MELAMPEYAGDVLTVSVEEHDRLQYVHRGWGTCWLCVLMIQPLNISRAVPMHPKMKTGTMQSKLGDLCIG